MIRRVTASALVPLVLLAGCETTAPPPADQPVHASPRQTPSRPVAFVAGQSITDESLRAGLIEAAGGQVLAEVVLDRAIKERLAERGLTVTQEHLDRELANVLATLSDDPAEAARLLVDLRAERGLGEQRFEAMLFRNAGLRLLVQDEVQIPPSLLRQAYQLQHGERYRVRIIVADTIQDAQTLRRRAVGGESFGDLAALHSKDPSAAQGGLLSPINPADMSYPKALRDALKGLDPGGVSDLIAADQRFIIMKLETVITADPVEFEDVKAALNRSVRLEAEGQLMGRTARAMLAEATVVVLDPALNKSWRAEQAKTKALTE
jgi:parvulin-like peptidyl-prolyl isomerase